MIFASEESVKSLLVAKSAVAAIQNAFANYDAANLVVPSRMQLALSSESTLLIMPCFDKRKPALSIKIVLDRSVAKGEDGGVQATYIQINPQSGQADAVISANYLTDVRTAAVSSVATRCLARQDAATLGVFGTGRQARAHILLLSEVHRFKRVLVCGSSLTKSIEFAREYSGRCGIAIDGVDAKECAAESDVLCTCTTSRVPLFDGRLVRNGTHLNLVGTYRPDAAEVDVDVIRRARIVVENRESALAEAGDLMIPMRKGLIDHTNIVGDLHEIVTGKKIGRQEASDITLFKSVGWALEDMAVGSLVCERALERGVSD